MIVFAIDIMNTGKFSVRSYVDLLQSKGRYTFLKSELTQKPGLPTTNTAIELSLNRLLKKHRIAMIRQGFYIIVPIEYQSNGILPAAWFIHQLMEYLELPYYVALLSAAAIHGCCSPESCPGNLSPSAIEVVSGPPLASPKAPNKRAKRRNSPNTIH